MERAVVNTETGEVTSVIYDGDRILRKETLDYLKANKQSSRPFAKIDENEGRYIMCELDTYEKSVLFSLQFYVSYDSGLIRFSNGKEIGFTDIVELTGLSRAKANEAVEGLIKKDILYKGKNSRKVQYFMNPWIVNKGTINSTLKEMFRNYRIRSKGNVLWKDIK